MTRRLRPFAALLVAPVIVSASAAVATPAAATAPSAGACEPIAGPEATTRTTAAAVSTTATPAATFGPLAHEPALRTTVADGIHEADRVPGGVVVTTGPESDANALTFVEDTGAIRWRACFDVTPWPVSAETDPTFALVDLSGFEAPRDPVLVDLATGTVGPSDALPSGRPHYRWAEDPASGLALFGPTPEAFDLPAGSDLTIVDLGSDTATVVASPEISADVIGPRFGFGTDGTLALFGRDGKDGAVALAYVDGAWTDDAAVIDAAFPMWTSYGIDAPITFFRASGAEAWTLGDVWWIADEGFHSLAVDDIVLIRACTDPPTPEVFQCEHPVLLAASAATGTELWRMEVAGGVVAAADGYTLLGTAAADDTFSQTMVETATGTPIDGQVWPEPTPFHVGCCGDPSFTIIDGGTVLTSDGLTLEMFVPIAAAAPTVVTAL